MKLKLALLAAAGSLALIPAAMAGEGWYGGIGAGYTLDEDSNDLESEGGAVFGAGTPVDFVTDYDLDGGINIYGVFGKYLRNGLRGELEFATRTQDVDDVPGDGLGFGGFATDGGIGDVSVSTYMVNLYKDFNNFGDTRIAPYIGAGVGFARTRVDVNNVSLTGPAMSVADTSRLIIGNKDNALALQAMAGLVVDLADNVALDIRYKFLATDEFQYDGFVNNVPVNLTSLYRANEITAGFRWNFGAPAPVPVAAAAPTPPPVRVQYRDCWDGSRVVATAECPPEIVETVDAPENLALTVYFDYDKSNLTGAAQSLISAKSQEALEYDISSVTVSGNTDTSGSAAYNNALSARRASVVRDALVGNGVNGGAISVKALGESNLAKSTGDGVREPLNRRTDVEFKF